MRPYYPISQFKQDKEKIDRENGYWLIAIVVMIIFAFAVIIIANWRMQTTDAAEQGNTMRANLRTCKNKVVYGQDENAYVYHKGRRVYLIKEGC